MGKFRTELGLRKAVAIAFQNALEERGLSQTQAAFELGVTKQSISLYLKAKVMPGGKVLRKAIKEWGITIDYQDFKITAAHFETVQVEPATMPEQLSLMDFFSRLKDENYELKIVQTDKSSFEMRLLIKIAS